jgi:DNA-binding Lrp family transcriptional regulator
MSRSTEVGDVTLEGLDELDRCILYLLQRDARGTTSRDVAARMDVSPSTVRKRIDRLEAEGLIEGYRAQVNYGRAGYQLRFQIVCTAPIPEREALADRALSVPGVVTVREVATGEENVLVSAVAADTDDLTRIAGALSDLGLAVSDEQLIRDERSRPFHDFDPSDPPGATDATDATDE